MKVEVRDESTLVLTAETVAEHVLLKRFEGVTAKLETVRPFGINATTLILEVKK